MKVHSEIFNSADWDVVWHMSISSEKVWLVIIPNYPVAAGIIKM